MRFATANIPAGGFDSYRDTMSAAPDQLARIQELVRRAKADTVVLCNMFLWEQISPQHLRDTFHDWNDLEGLDFSHLFVTGLGPRATDESRLDLAVLSRHGSSTRAVRIYDRNCTRTTVYPGDGRQIIVYGVYLDLVNDHVRLQEVEWLVVDAQLYPDDEVWIIGNLNLPSSGPLSQVMPTLIQAGFRSICAGVETNPMRDIHAAPGSGPMLKSQILVRNPGKGRIDPGTIHDNGRPDYMLTYADLR